MELTESLEDKQYSAAANETKSPLPLRVYYLTAIALVIVDQITKIAVKGFSIFGWSHQGMYLGESIPVIGEVLRITFVENPGMAFGISFGAGKIFLTLFSLVAAAGLLWYLSRIHFAKTIVKVGIMLLIAGALGNFIDRAFYGVLFGEGDLFYGLVVDFIQVDIPDINIGGLYYTHFPVFNVADSCVSCGMAAIIWANKYLPTISEAKYWGKPQQQDAAADS